MGGSRYPVEPHNVEDALNDAVKIDFQAVPHNIVTKLDYVYKNILALTDINPSKIDWFLLNQANAVHQGRWIVNTGFPVEKGFSNMVNLGNCAAAYLGLDDGEAREALAEAVSAGAAEAARALSDGIESLPALDDGAVERVQARVRERQAAVGYDGDLAAWIARVTPDDLE